MLYVSKEVYVKFANVVTIVVSVMLSVSGAMLAIRRPIADRSAPIRTTTIQLVDKEGRVRMTLGTLDTQDGKPEMQMTDATGKVIVLLSTNSRDEGTLYFSSPVEEGKVAIGYLWGSDTPSVGEDPLGSWGVRVLGRQDLSSMGIAVGNDGKHRLWGDGGVK
jgi:hypothetical protein